jgi:hypothetical protein
MQNIHVIPTDPKQETLEEVAEKESEVQGWGKYEGASEQYAIKSAYINGFDANERNYSKLLDFHRFVLEKNETGLFANNDDEIRAKALELDSSPLYFNDDALHLRDWCKKNNLKYLFKEVEIEINSSGFETL